MVGGIVYEVLTLENRIWVNVRDQGWNPETQRNDRPINDFCAIYVERNQNSERIKPGDSLWWQGRFAMWTPKENRKPEGAGRCKVDYDIEIPRLGYSGASHPAQALIESAYSEQA